MLSELSGHVYTHIAGNQVAATPIGKNAVLPIDAAHVVRDYVEPITTGLITQASESHLTNSPRI